MTTFKTLTVAAVISLAPAISFAAGCNYGSHDKQAQSCISGSTWDEATQSCQPVTSS